MFRLFFYFLLCGTIILSLLGEEKIFFKNKEGRADVSSDFGSHRHRQDHRDFSSGNGLRPAAPPDHPAGSGAVFLPGGADGVHHPHRGGGPFHLGPQLLPPGRKYLPGLGRSGEKAPHRYRQAGADEAGGGGDEGYPPGVSAPAGPHLLPPNHAPNGGGAEAERHLSGGAFRHRPGAFGPPAGKEAGGYRQYLRGLPGDDSPQLQRPLGRHRPIGQAGGGTPVF